MSLLRCCPTNRAINLAFIIPKSNSHLARSRGFVSNQPLSSLPPTKPDPTPEYTSGRHIQDRFGGSVVSAFKNLGKVFAWVGYGTIIVGLVTITAFEGAHFWIEHKMSIEPDEDAEQWGWEPEAWTGGKYGGTSSALGLYGRHAVRSAWFTLHYASSFTDVSSISPVYDGPYSGSLNVVDSDLHNARVYLENAISCMKNADGALRLDKVVNDLLERHAAVLERIGTRAALVRARDDYIFLFEERSEAKLSQAKFAVKLGNICNRLGDGESAFAWWLRGINLTRDDRPSDQPSMDVASTAETMTPEWLTGSIEKISTATKQSYTNALWKWIKGLQPLAELPSSSNAEMKSCLEYSLPVKPPNSPTAQRTLVTAMLALSAYYTREMRLQEAQEIEERATSLINAMIPPTPTSVSRTAAQTLHYMYLTHRKSVLTLHHAEVTYAMRSKSVQQKHSPIMDVLTQLLTAASMSEQVAQTLTGKPSLESPLTSELNSDSPMGSVSLHPPGCKGGLAPSLTVSTSLRPAAQTVLQDARLTATEAWDLSGVLYGEIGDAKAVGCFERALAWAGEPTVAGKDREGTAMKAWESLWERYVEAKKKWTQMKDPAKANQI